MDNHGSKGIDTHTLHFANWSIQTWSTEKENLGRSAKCK